MNTNSVRSCRDRLWRPANVTVTFIFHTPRRISLQAEDPAAASGSGQITTESGSIHSLVWLLTYSAFLRSNNTASTLSEPGQSLIRFGRVPGAKTSLAPRQPSRSMCISRSAASENTRNAPMCSGSSSAVACGQEAPCKALGRTAASKSHTLSPATMQLGWQHPKDARCGEGVP